MIGSFLKNKKIGFTLVEMLISISIIGAITAVVFWNQNKFNSDLDITNLAYRVALAVREAQVYGVSVKSAGGTFNQAYGIHLHMGDEESKKNILLFADNIVTDQQYSGDIETTACPQGGECVERVTMNRGNRLKHICLSENNGSTVNCASDSTLDIIFKRPNPDALFVEYSGSTGTINRDVHVAYLCLTSPDGKEKEVSVYATGQISIDSECHMFVEAVEVPLGPPPPPTGGGRTGGGR